MLHFHKYEIIGAETGESENLMGARWPSTQVLMKCDCGKIKTKLVNGHWELEDLLANKR